MVWNDPKIIPEEINKNSNGTHSIDVLCYFYDDDEHSIGWFNYIDLKWFFLCNQDYSNQNFKWRYFQNEIDKINYEGKKRNRN